jgi:anti-anti-sigma factor
LLSQGADVAEIDAKVVVEWDGEEVAIARLLGEHDLASMSETTDQLRELVAGEGVRLVIDVSETLFFDSTGLRMLFGLDAELREAGRRLVIQCDASAPMWRLLEVAGVPEAMPVCGERATAVAVAQTATQE